ncbi:hypothetical protein GWK47_028515 [Chionoecetes opilio]|uniref:Uncharacterized protein n=1 Tax=Chionoecetes opilio TaxID=41210 RepID=A0A8J4YP11_CHIOP|nr:hypothetical protein GWK47_028515 [Chionoecetes opilio]
MMSGLLEVQGLVRSPSGCSEASMVRPAGRGIGLGPSSSSRALGGHSLSGATQHQAGQCYIGFALPLDLDLLLYDASMDKKAGPGDGGPTASNSTPGKDRFPAITESELETQSEEDPDKKKTGSPKRKAEDVKAAKDEGNGLELHTLQTCLACFTLTPPSVPPTPRLPGEGEGEGEGVVESPPLPRVKVISEASEASDPSSLNSQGWEDTGEVKVVAERVNQTLFRKEVLRFITNLLSSIAAKSSRQVYAETSRIMKQKFEGLCETMNPAVQDTATAKTSGSSLQPPSMADIAEVTLSDKSDREEDC